MAEHGTKVTTGHDENDLSRRRTATSDRAPHSRS